MPGTLEVPGTLLKETTVSQGQRGIARFREREAAVRETLSGYAQAAAVMERERMERLARMTPEEACAIYDDLCRTWATQAHDHSLERMAQWRLETLLAVREAMARLAHTTGNEQ
ncbi:MAG: hypothetical protein ACE5OS_10960 [Anaerolineae bacterium]